MSETITVPVAPRSNLELANSISHGVGLAGAIAATPILVVGAVRSGSAADIVGSSVFAASMIALYLASTTYHAARAGRLKARLRQFDHAAIFLLIAGSYTPFTLGVLGGAWGWTLFGLVWGAAALGIGQKLFMGLRYPRLSTAMYVIMGWLIVIAIRPLLLRMPPAGLAWLVAGGLFYSVGVVFYATQRIRCGHFIWHLFVLGGSICHFFAVLWYAVG